MDEATKKEVEDIAKKVLRRDFSKRIGDTPTDDLQLVNKKYVDSSGGKIYSANIDNTGTIVVGSSKISSVSHSLTGKYTITHNLGHLNYITLGIISTSSPAATCITLNKTTTTCAIWIYNSANNLDDLEFNIFIHDFS